MLGAAGEPNGVPEGTHKLDLSPVESFSLVSLHHPQNLQKLSPIWKNLLFCWVWIWQMGIMVLTVGDHK